MACLGTASCDYQPETIIRLSRSVTPISRGRAGRRIPTGFESRIEENVSMPETAVIATGLCCENFGFTKYIISLLEKVFNKNIGRQYMPRLSECQAVFSDNQCILN